MKRSEEAGIFLTGQSERTRIAEPRGADEMTGKKARFGQFEVDFGRFLLFRAGEPVRLEGLPLRLLMYLLDHHGELVTREQIADTLWGKDVFVGVESSSSAMRILRMAVGHGYRFVALFSPSEE